MKKVQLRYLFALTLLITLFETAFFPSVRLFAFAPLLAQSYYRLSFMKALWVSSLCGLILDLFSSHHFGLASMSCALTTFFLYKYKRHFFEDKAIAFSLFTALISCAHTAAQLLGVVLFDKSLAFSWKLIGTDLIAMPCVDALYAYCVCSCLFAAQRLIQKIPRLSVWIRFRSFFLKHNDL